MKVTDIGFSKERFFICFETEEQAARYCQNGEIECEPGLWVERWPFGDVPKQECKFAVFTNREDGAAVRLNWPPSECVVRPFPDTKTP